MTVNYPSSLREIRAAIAEFRALGLRSRVINRLRNHNDVLRGGGGTSVTRFSILETKLCKTSV